MALDENGNPVVTTDGKTAAADPKGVTTDPPPATTDPTPSPEGDPSSPPPQGRKPGAEKRIGTLIGEREYWKGRAEAAEAAVSVPKEKPAEAPAAKDLDRMDFDSDADYLKAVGNKNLETMRAEFAASEGKKKALEFQNARQIQVDAARAKYDDFDEVALNRTLPVSQGMIDAAAGENYADILYALGSEPEEARRIFHLPPIEQIKEIGRIESRLKQPKIKNQSAAPAPPNTLSGSGNSPGQVAESDMGRGDLHAKWEKERQEEIKRNYG